MKKYILVLTSAFSFALDANVSYGSIGMWDSDFDMYSIGLAQELSSEQYPVSLEIGGNANYYSMPFWSSSQCSPYFNFSTTAKLVFQFSNNSAAFVGRSLYYLPNDNTIFRGGIFGFKKIISDTQSFQFSYEIVELKPENNQEDNYYKHDDYISMEPRFVITAAKTLI